MSENESEKIFHRHSVKEVGETEDEQDFANPEQNFSEKDKQTKTEAGRQVS